MVVLSAGVNCAPRPPPVLESSKPYCLVCANEVETRTVRMTNARRNPDEIRQGRRMTPPGIVGLVITPGGFAVGVGLPGACAGGQGVPAAAMIVAPRAVMRKGNSDK